MFDERHYVPILRWKGAERIAIQKLAPDVKDLMTPLIEIVPKDFTKVPAQARAKQLAESWGWQRRFFVDFHQLEQGSVPMAVGRFLQEARKYRLKPVFTAPLAMDDPVLEAIRSVVNQESSGFALRLDAYELRQANMQRRIMALLASLSLTPEEVDLIVDFGIVSEVHPSFGSFLNALPELTRWRSLTACSGAFPRDLSEMEKNHQYEIPRHDWNAWRDCASNGAVRIPTFGDYTIQHPVFEENEGQLRNFSASIRYASERVWVIMRGQGVHTDDGPGYAQYPAQALLLSERAEFKGESFSFGDGYIKAMSCHGTKTGGPKEWLAAGINHHVTLTVRQLAQVFVVANGNESARG
jgi:hypothetical protein